MTGRTCLGAPSAESVMIDPLTKPIALLRGRGVKPHPGRLPLELSASTNHPPLPATKMNSLTPAALRESGGQGPPVRKDGDREVRRGTHRHHHRASAPPPKMLTSPTVLRDLPPPPLPPPPTQSGPPGVSRGSPDPGGTGVAFSISSSPGCVPLQAPPHRRRGGPSGSSPDSHRLCRPRALGSIVPLWSPACR